jgi:hypothetical protein
MALAAKSKTPFNWKTFSTKLAKLIKFASKASIIPIKESRWEELIFHALKGMGKKYKGGDPKWEVGSHLSGADLWIDNLAISAKSGSITKDSLDISSYRLGRFLNLKTMIKFIDGDGKNFDVYLSCVVINHKDGHKTYKIFVIPANVFSARKIKWSRIVSKDDGKVMKYYGSDSRGVSARIVKSMSHQLWIRIPLKLCKQIAEITIPKKDLGSALAQVARK